MALTGKDLIVVDEYYDEIATQLQYECEKLNTAYKSYIRILNDICSEAITEGETSEALHAFAKLAERLSGILQKVGDSFYLSLDAYPDAIDKADQYLY